MPISFRVHFGNAVNGWNLKELVIYIGKDIFMHYKFWGDKFNNTFFGDRTPSEDDGCFSDEAPDRGPDDYVLPDSSLAFNIQHPAYNFLIRESFSENCINGIFVGYPILNNKWFILDRLGLLLTCDNHENVMETPLLCWKNIIAWGYYEEYDYRSNKQDDFTNSTRNLISHLICFPVFSLLEDKTLSSVRFKTMAFLVEPQNIIKINATGIGTSLDSIVLQSDQFGKTGVLKDVVFSSVQPNDKGIVDFSFQAKIDPKYLLYSKS
jgi:hypothetical protein